MSEKCVSVFICILAAVEKTMKKNYPFSPPQLACPIKQAPDLVPRFYAPNVCHSHTLGLAL